MDPMIGWFEIVKLSNDFVNTKQDGEGISKVIINKSLATTFLLFKQDIIVP